MRRKKREMYGTNVCKKFNGRQTDRIQRIRMMVKGGRRSKKEQFRVMNSKKEQEGRKEKKNKERQGKGKREKDNRRVEK